MGIEIWLAIYFVIGLAVAALMVRWMNKIDPISGNDNPFYVGIPVFVVWPIIMIALVTLLVYNKVRTAKTE